ncbi:MAG: DUF3293 domain-containing protein [Leptospiraceae bacterium]|nr:DUF3293 domain-containing protein [Leptospiraceae bacterium]
MESIYEFYYHKTIVTLRINQINEELDRILEADSFSTYSFITANNPKSMRLKSSENKQRNLELEKILIDKQFIYYSGLGYSQDMAWKEESFCIFGISLIDAKELGSQFGQNAILFGEIKKYPELVILDSKIIL